MPPVSQWQSSWRQNEWSQRDPFQTDCFSPEAIRRREIHEMFAVNVSGLMATARQSDILSKLAEYEACVSEQVAQSDLAWHRDVAKELLEGLGEFRGRVLMLHKQDPASLLGKGVASLSQCVDLLAIIRRYEMTLIIRSER
jgi:hypothetical protein